MFNASIALGQAMDLVSGVAQHVGESIRGLGRDRPRPGRGPGLWLVEGDDRRFERGDQSCGHPCQGLVIDRFLFARQVVVRLVVRPMWNANVKAAPPEE